MYLWYIDFLMTKGMRQFLKIEEDMFNFMAN
jgi:hypothetical protein